MRINMEKSIVKKIMKQLESDGYFCVKIHGGAFQLAGLPDILALKDGLAAWIEVKRPGGKPTKLQTAMLQKMQRFGCCAGVATNIEEAMEIVNGHQSKVVQP